MRQGTVVDTNVLLDLFMDDSRWADWSADHLAAAFDAGPVVINPRIYAAVASRALLTRDRPRHTDLLPRLRVIAPE